MKYEYARELISRISEQMASQEANIDRAIELFTETIVNDKIIHCFGTGHSHMIAIEAFIRAGGLANVDAMLDPDAISSSGAVRGGSVERLPGLADIIWDDYVIQPGDIMVIISNSGRNAVPVEMAMRARREGITAIAITSMEQSKANPSRHSSGKKLYELCDVCIDNFVPNGDALVQLGDGQRIGAFSTVSGVAIINTIITEACKAAVTQGAQPPIYTSQNIEGYDNDALYKRYRGRIKFM